MEATVYTPDQIHDLPQQPGVYRFYNSERKLIYVGKAKNLKKRVSSYFTKQKGVNRKTVKMVGEIKTLEFTIVNSEFDALLLENNLIKEFQPRYNILLRDDKTYPYICVTNEPFPRIISTRKVIPSGGTYYGPFASVKAMNNILELIRKLYTIRTCKYSLTDENIKKGKFRVCLEYHIGNCKGPCEGLQQEEDYLQDIQQASQILKGNLQIPKHYFKEQMQKAAGEMAFERAQRFKDKLELLDKFQSRSLVVNQKYTDIDVFSIMTEDKKAYVNYLRIKNGTINLTKTIEVKKALNEPEEDILTHALLHLRDLYQSASKEILTNIPLPDLEDSLHITVPKIGDKKKLIDMSYKNLLFYKKEKANQQESTKIKELRVLKQLQEDLHLKDLPIRIECFDNSNIQGAYPVASMVHFKNGRPMKSEYRHFNIKTVVGPNDFASMEEIVGRRYKRLQEEHLPLPNLIVIDGGKGQLASACAALKKLELYGKVPIVGIAKRLEEIYVPEDPYPVHIDKKSPSLKLIQRLRDEAHRFAITFHRQKRSQQTFKTELEEIKGIGKETADKLLMHFKSVKKVKEATYEALEPLVGSDKAEKIIRHWQ